MKKDDFYAVEGFLAIAIWLAVVGAAAYVLHHFITKYW